MERVAYIGRYTYNRLVKRLGLTELKILEERENEVGKIVLCVIPKISTLNTNINKYIYNNSDGKFFISDGVNDKNEVKITKVLKALWGIEDPNKLKELKAIWDSYYKPEIEIGKPSIIYNMEHTNIESCMIGNGSFYIGFEKLGLKVAYMLKYGEIVGRALVWETGNNVVVEAYDEEEKKWKKIKGFMDRVYYANEGVKEKFFRWAKERGLWRKKYQRYDATMDFIDEKGRGVNTKIIVRMKGEMDTPDYLPFMDTMYIMCIDNGEVIFFNSDTVECNCKKGYMLRRTGGEYDRLRKCEWCKKWRDEEQYEFYTAFAGGKWLEVCHMCIDRHFVYLKADNGINDIYISRDEVKYCEYCDSAIWVDDTGKVYSEDEEHLICEECGCFVCKGFVKFEEDEGGREIVLCPICYENREE